MPWFIRSAALAGIAIAVVAAPVAAFPVVPGLSAVAERAAADALPILRVRDVCRVRYEGRTKITSYCNDPYVCDRANPGKCKPGAELQRKLDADMARLDEMRRNLNAEIRNLRRTARKTYFARNTNSRADDRRASGCKQVRMFGNIAQICPGDAEKGRLSNSAYNDRIIPSPQYGKARPPQDRPVYGAVPRRNAQVAPRSRPPSLRAKTTMALMVRDFFQMEPNDPDRTEQQNKIVAKAKEFEAQGEDIAPELKRLFEEAAKEAADREKEKRGSVPDTPLPAEVPPPPAEQAAADPPKPYSDKDEALCSYLMTLAPDQRDDKARMVRLGQQVPAYCEPYLNSLPKPAATQEAAAPPFYLRESDKEEAHKLAEDFYRQEVLPPDYGK